MDIEVKNGAHFKMLLAAKIGEIQFELNNKLSRTAAKGIALGTGKKPIVPVPSTKQAVVIIKSNQKDVEKDTKAIGIVHENLVKRLRETKQVLKIVDELGD